MKPWSERSSEAIERFRDLLRIDTTNNPGLGRATGNERLAVDYLAKILRDHGVEPVIVEPEPGRASLIARIAGTGSGGGPLLLSSHLDVVPADPREWSHPPFAAEVADGQIWGRGAIDMKHMTVYGLTAFLAALESGKPPRRDLILAAVADEEAGSDLGMRWIVEQRPDLVQAEYALNEVGGFTMHVGQQRLYPIEIAEKGFVWMRLSVKGQAGHGSMPHPDNPVIKLSAAIQRIAQTKLPFRPTAVVDGFLREIGQSLGFPASLLLDGLRFGPTSDAVLDHLPDAEFRKVFHACLHNTACPTVLSGGDKINVIPNEASVLLDCRTIPGSTEEEIMAELRRVAGPGFDMEVLKSGPPVVFDAETPLFRCIERCVSRRDPGSKVVPYMLVGFTDSKWLASLGVKAYGFVPVRWPKGVKFTELFHGKDERIPIDGFLWGLRTFAEVVAETAGFELGG